MNVDPASAGGARIHCASASRFNAELGVMLHTWQASNNFHCPPNAVRSVVACTYTRRNAKLAIWPRRPSDQLADPNEGLIPTPIPDIAPFPLKLEPRLVSRMLDTVSILWPVPKLDRHNMPLCVPQGSAVVAYIH